MIEKKINATLIADTRSVGLAWANVAFPKWEDIIKVTATMLLVWPNDLIVARIEEATP